MSGQARLGQTTVNAMQQYGGGLSLLAAILCGAVGYVAFDSAAGTGALLGGLVAVVAFLAGTWAISLVLEHLPGVEIAGALALFLVQLLLLVSAVLVMREMSWINVRAAAFGLLISGLAYQIGQVWAFLTARMVAIDVALPGDEGREDV